MKKWREWWGKSSVPDSESDVQETSSEIYYRRIGKQQFTAELIVGLCPQPSEFRRSVNDPDRVHGGMSVGARSVILDNGETPESAMLRDEWRGSWLASFTDQDINVINSELGVEIKGMSLRFELKPTDNELWHGDILGLPADADEEDLTKVQEAFASRAKWYKPKHEELLGDWLPTKLNEAQANNPKAKIHRLNHLRKFAELADCPGSEDHLDTINGGLREAEDALRPKTRCLDCRQKFPFESSKAEKMPQCPNPKCKHSPFRHETIG